MTPSELLEQFRLDVADVATPYLWEDAEFFRYADEAQKQFTRLTDGIPESTSAPVTEIAVTAGNDTYALSPLVLKVRAARTLSDGRPLEVLNLEDMVTRGNYFDGRTGTVKVVVTGMDVDTVRVWPMPSEDMTVKLSVFRMPLVDITDVSVAFEIAPHHHLNLLDWVKHRAYRKQDAEAFDKQKSDEFKTAFETYCTKVKAEQARARHKPRAVAYGGI